MTPALYIECSIFFVLLVAHVIALFANRKKEQTSPVREWLQSANGLVDKCWEDRDVLSKNAQ